MIIKDLSTRYKSGDRYGNLLLTGKSYVEPQGNQRRRKVEAICVCGKIYFVELYSLRRGATKGCGCKRIEAVRKAIVTHGMSVGGKKDIIFQAWEAMSYRCNGITEDYKNNYTLRGITICEEWKNDFELFRKWSVANGWQKGLSLDRIDNDKGYSPENCRWATRAIQNRNKRGVTMVSAFGEVKCLADWEQDSRCMVSDTTIHRRIKKLNWDTERAITHPSLKSRWQIAQQ